MYLSASEVCYLWCYIKCSTFTFYSITRHKYHHHHCLSAAADQVNDLLTMKVRSHCLFINTTPCVMLYQTLRLIHAKCHSLVISSIHGRLMSIHITQDGIHKEFTWPLRCYWWWCFGLNAERHWRWPVWMPAEPPGAGWSGETTAPGHRRPAVDSCALSVTTSRVGTYSHRHRPGPTDSDPSCSVNQSQSLWDSQSINSTMDNRY